MNMTPDEYEIHAYIDGRLEEARRREVELYLAQHPDRAEEVQAWKRDAQRLRVAFGAWPPMPDRPDLDPARIRVRGRQRARARTLIAATIVVGFCAGGIGGWQARGWRAMRASPPMGDALAAYRLVAEDHSLRLDIASNSRGALQAWLDRQFASAVRLPSLQGTGYQPVGGRLFVTNEGPAAMVLYEDAQGHAISFYVRPPGDPQQLLPRGRRAQGDLLAQYGSDRSYNYAVVSRADDADQRVAAQVLANVI